MTIKLDDALRIVFESESDMAQYTPAHARRVSKAQPKYHYTQMGKAFPSSEGLSDVSAMWPYGAAFYDPDTNEVIFFYNSTNGHNIGKCSVMMRRKRPDAEFFSAPQIIASDKSVTSFRCHAAKKAANGDYIAIITTQTWGSSTNGMTGTFVYRSNDSGETWASAQLQLDGSMVISDNVVGLLVTQTGRILTSVRGQPFIYSDDHGVTWSQSTATVGDLTEPAWCDLGDGRLIAMVRIGIGGNFSVSSPAKFMKSEDNGATWTSPANSTSVLDYTASNGEMIVDRDNETVEFIHHSRFTMPDDFSSLYVSRATLDEAWNDDFQPQVRIGKLAAYTTLGDSTGDSGYVAAARSENGVINVFFYTGKRTSAQISWMIGTPDTTYNAARVIDYRTGEYLTYADLVTP